MLTQIVPDSAPAVKSPAEKAREYADIHADACRWRRAELVCSMCHDTEERAVGSEANRG